MGVHTTVNRAGMNTPHRGINTSPPAQNEFERIYLSAHLYMPNHILVLFSFH